MSNRESTRPAPRRQSPHARPAFFRRQLVAWFARAGRDLPWRHTRDPYAILVSEFMLQQTRVAVALDYYQRWMRRFPHWHALAHAPEQEVFRLWQGLGYYTRARNIQQTARVVLDRFDGTPHTRDPGTLRTLPGIGPYTAAALAAFSSDVCTPVIDGNVARVVARLFNLRLAIDRAPGRAALSRLTTSLLPQRRAGRFSAALMELGALICLPRHPQCRQCPVQSHCAAPRPAQLPIRKPRPVITQRADDRLLALRAARVLLLQPSESSPWRGLHPLPPHTPDPTRPDTRPILQSRYTITRYRVTLRLWRADRSATRAALARGAHWHALARIDTIPMPAPHRRALDRALQK